MKEREQNEREVDRSIKRSSSLAANEGGGLSQSLALEEEQDSDTDLDAVKESRNPFKQRSKSYIFSRGYKVKRNASPEKMTPSLQQEKKGWSSVAVFGTLPHKEGKKKKSKKANKQDNGITRLSEPLIDFEDYGQYSEENPPPLPPRPQLPPLQSPYTTSQPSTSSVDSNGLSWSGPVVTSSPAHRALETSRRLPSCEWEEEEESNLDFMRESVPREDASPYEVPVTLQAPAVKKTETARPGPVYSQVNKMDKGASEPPPRVLHASFRQPDSAEDISSMSQRIGLRQLITDPPPHPLVPPVVSKMASSASPGKPNFRRHRRAGSYDPSLLRSVKQGDTPPTPPPLSQQYPAYSVSSVQPVPPPLPRKTRPPMPLHTSLQLDNELYRTSTFPAQSHPSIPPKTRTRFPFPKPNVPDIPQQVLPESNLHSRQASLPDFLSLDYNSSTKDGMQTEYSNAGLHGPPVLDHTKRPGKSTSSKLTTEVRSLKSSSEGFGSELGPSRNSSSEERDCTVESARERMQKRRSILSDEGNLYEQIDDDVLQSILGSDAMPSPFPRPLYLSDAKLDADAIQEIQQWHVGFMKCYLSWLKDLNAIVQRSEQRHTPTASKEGRQDGSHKDSGTSTSLSREELAEPPNAPTQDPPPPSPPPSAVHLAKSPSPSSQPSPQDERPPAVVSEELWADTEPAPSTVQALPNLQEESIVVHLTPKAHIESRSSQQQQPSEKTADENDQEAQQYCKEATDDEKQQSVKPVCKPEQRIVIEKPAIHESPPQQQQTVNTVGRVAQSPSERTAAECNQQHSEKAAGSHQGRYGHLTGLHPLYAGPGLTGPGLTGPRKVSLV